jgi:hypothetical protein
MTADDTKITGFKEIEVSPKEVRFKGYNGNITITIPLIRKHWNSGGFTHVQIFHDEENKKVGLKPSKDKGYKLFISGKAWRVCSRPITKVVVGVFKPIWNEQLGMLIINYGKKETRIN